MRAPRADGRARASRARRSPLPRRRRLTHTLCLRRGRAAGCFGKREDELPPAVDLSVSLCEKLKGPNVTVENASVVSGTGSILGDSPILQDKGYFEVTIMSAGTFAVGVATRETDLDSVLSQDKAATASSGEVSHASKFEIFKLGK